MQGSQVSRVRRDRVTRERETRANKFNLTLSR